MKLEQQVPSLELCKRLKELGYPQVELFWWVCYDGKWVVEKHHGWSEAYKHADEQVYCAPTVAELGETLPMDDGYTYYSFRTTKSNDSRIYWMSKRSNGEKARYEEDFSEANARAKMLIYLLENKLISL